MLPSPGRSATTLYKFLPIVLFGFAGSALAHAEPLPASHVEDFERRVGETHPELFAFYRAQKVEESKITSDVGEFTRTQRNLSHRLRKKKQPPERALIVQSSIRQAWASDPPDWATLAVAFKCAEWGEPDEYVLDSAARFLKSLDDIPADELPLTRFASRVLALSGDRERHELLMSFVEKDTLGIADDADQTWSERWNVGMLAISAIYTCMPIPDARRCFQELEKQFDAATAVPGSYDAFVARKIEIGLQSLK
jgi:hypothetical protein